MNSRKVLSCKLGRSRLCIFAVSCRGSCHGVDGRSMLRPTYFRCKPGISTYRDGRDALAAMGDKFGVEIFKEVFSKSKSS
jgi:hypothetical protein